MKTSVRWTLRIGGILNLLLAFFHVFLCYQIYYNFSSMPVYPLLLMFSIGGMLMIFFLAYTSLFCSADLISTKTGRAVLMLNILVYLTRVLGEFILPPRQNFLIVGVCSFLTILYVVLYFNSRSSSPAQESVIP